MKVAAAGAPLLQPVAGLRALACLGIIATHISYWTLMAAEDRKKVYGWLDDSPLTTFMLSIGEPSLDMFLSISGYLAAASLLPALETAPNTMQTVGRYYRKRLLRIAPNLYSVLHFTAAAIIPLGSSQFLSAEARRAFFTEVPYDLKQCPGRLWASFAFMNNLLPMGGCSSTTWSLAVTAQFCFLFPLLLIALRPKTAGFRGRVGLMAGALVGVSLLQRAHLAISLRLWDHMPVSLFGPHDHPGTRETLAALSSGTYMSTLSRGGALALGALAALVVHTPAARQVLARWRGAALGALLLLGIVVLGAQVQNRTGAQPDRSHMLAKPVTALAGFVVLAGLLQPLVGALLLALSTANLPGAASWLTAALSHPWLARFADLSYDVYLLHPMVILAVYAAFPPSQWYSPSHAANLILAFAVVTALSAVAAYWHGRLWQHVSNSLEGRFFGKMTQKESGAKLSPVTSGRPPRSPQQQMVAGLKAR